MGRDSLKLMCESSARTHTYGAPNWGVAQLCIPKAAHENCLWVRSLVLHNRRVVCLSLQAEHLLSTVGCTHSSNQYLRRV